MSNEVFPSQLQGFTWECKKKPIFNTITHSPPTGRDVRISLYSQPVYEFTLSNQWLTKADKDLLIGFFLARKGGFDSFLYQDEDCVVANQQLVALDSSLTIYQLIKSTAAANEVVNNAYVSDIWLSSGLGLDYPDDYSIDPTGLITLFNVPDSSVIWSGSCYYRCVFLEDSLEYNQFADRLYDCGEISFKGCLANKL
jgi:hypothetical protein